MQKKSWNISRKDGDSGWAAVMEEGIPLDGYPSLDELYAAAEEKKIPRQALSSGKILEKELARARSFPGEFFSFPIIRPDGFDVRLSVSNDKLRAFLYVRKAADAPHTLDFKLIASVLNSSKIRFADPDLLKERLFQFRDSDEMELVDLPVAEGIPPSKGISAGLRENVKWLEGAEFAAIRRRISVWAENHIAEYGNLFRTPPEISSPGLKIGFVVQGDLALEFVCGEPGKPGVDIYGAAIPGLSGDAPVIHTDETLSVEPEGIRAGQHGAFLLEDSGNALFARILPYCDAYAELQPSADRMELFLTLCPAAGAGEPLTEERVRAAFSGQTAAAVQEFDRARIQALIREAETAGRECKTRIAQGTPAVPPGSPLVVWDASGPGGIVRKGGKILAYRVMEAGANGRDVLGNPIPFTGKEAVPVPQPGFFVEKREEDGWWCFYAAVSGEIIRNGEEISVSDRREFLRDVGPDDPSECFPGAVVIRGNVQKGATVKAEGVLTLNGNADASILSSEDSVVVKGGIKGEKLGTVWARNGIDIGFAENARLLAGGDVRVEKYCFRCAVKTNGRFSVGGIPGILTGGTVRARYGVEAVQLGTARKLRTVVSFGQNYIVGEQVEFAEQDFAKVMEELAGTEKKLRALAGGDDDPVVRSLRQKKLSLMKQKERLAMRIFTLKECFGGHAVSKVLVHGDVWPGVILESHGRYFEVNEKMTGVYFFFDPSPGIIRWAPLENSGSGNDTGR